MSESLRVRDVRKSLGLTMEKFGERLGVTKAAVSNIENGNRSLTDQMRKSICREFSINEDWLRFGSGDMLREMPAEDEIAMYIEELLYGTESSTKRAIKAFISVYVKMSDVSKKVMDRAIDDWLAEMRNAGG